jgi:hypothetical protein
MLDGLVRRQQLPVAPGDLQQPVHPEVLEDGPVVGVLDALELALQPGELRDELLLVAAHGPILHGAARSSP